MSGDAPPFRKPEASEEGARNDLVLPSHLARLFVGRQEMSGEAGSSLPSSRGDHNPVNTSVTSREKSSLVEQLKGTELEWHDNTRRALARLDRVEVASLPVSVQQLAREVQLELSKTIDHYREGKIDVRGLQELIGRIDKPYRMYIKYDNYPEQELVGCTLGSVAELKHINRLVESDQAASVIIPGAQPGMQYTLEHFETKAEVHVDMGPLGETDALYLGRDGKVHADEVKAGMPTLRSGLRSYPYQLEKLAVWQGRAPEEREIRVVLSRPDRWTDLFKRIDIKQPNSPSTYNILVEHRIPIHIGDTTFMPEDLEMLKEQVISRLRGKSATQARILMERLALLSPKDVALGDFRL